MFRSVSRACRLVARDGQGISGWAPSDSGGFMLAHTMRCLLGPIAVHPTHQGEGLGGFLIHEGIEAGRAKGLGPGHAGR